MLAAHAPAALTNAHAGRTLSVTVPSRKGDTLPDQLTERQQQILTKLKAGMKPAEVGEDLGISRNAVYQHITSLKQKGMLDSGRQAAALHDDVFGSMSELIARAEARITEITEQEARLKEEREQLAAFVKRNRDLIPA